MERFIIYGLFDPRSHELRYIGKSTKGLRRAREHTANWALQSDGETHKVRWLRSLLVLGLTPEIRVLEAVPDGIGLDKAEQNWISEYLPSSRLTNLTRGGDGLSGHIRSQQTKELDRAAGRKRWENPEYRQKVLEKRFSRWTPEVRQRASTIQVGHTRNSVSVIATKDGVSEEFSSLHQAASRLGVFAGNICKVLKGQRRSTGGYSFVYSETP